MLTAYICAPLPAAKALTAAIQARQVQATVALIRALGGGWNERALPTEKQTLPFGPLDYRVVPPDVK